MKKVLFSLIMIVILSLTACTAKTNKLVDINEDLYYEVDGLTFSTEEAEYSTDVKKITYTITNTSAEERCVSGDRHFELHYKTEDGWKMVNYKKDVYFNALARILKPGESVTHTLDLEEYYYLPLDAGEYRITDEYAVSSVFEIS